MLRFLFVHFCESVYADEMLPVKGVKGLCDYCFATAVCVCVCCLRTVILLSPCHLTLNVTSPSLYLSIMLSQSLTGRIRAVRTDLYKYVCAAAASQPL